MATPKEMAAFGLPVVVQIAPEALGGKYAGCFALAVETHPWGVTSHIPIPKKGGTKCTPVRLIWDDFEIIGPPEWKQERVVETAEK